MSILIGAGFFYFRTSKKELKSYAMTPAWELAIDQVVNVWEQGPDLLDSHLLSQCPQYRDFQINNELTHCNENLFKCYFQQRKGKVSIKNKWIPYQLTFSKAPHQRRDLNIVLTLNNASAIPLRLKNNCHQITLPQGFYRSRFYKKSNKLNDNLWHTSGIDYIVDKYLVRNNEVLAWAQEKEKQVIANSLQKKDPFAVSTELTANQMEEFCRDYDSQVLTAKIHDALTFHHGRQSVEDIGSTPPSINSAPHPFGPRKDDGPQFKEKFSKEGCSKIYSKNCKDEKVARTFPEGIGWSGVAELLGGELEYVVNQYLPRRNLVASSFYFPYNSIWHRAGEFAYWNGLGHSNLNFNFMGEIPAIEQLHKKAFAVGFRCMKKKYIGGAL